MRTCCLGSRSATPTPDDIHKNTIPNVTGETTIAYIQRVKQQCDTETWEQFMAILSRQVDDPGSFDEVRTLTYLQFSVDELVGGDDQRC